MGDYYHHDLKEATEKKQCAIHAYVLLTNHIHLLLTPFKEFGVSHMMQDLGRGDYKIKIEEMTKRQVKPAPIGRPKIAEEKGCYLIL